jgi:5-methylcytosine-specific restriction endonuclease McrA
VTLYREDNRWVIIFDIRVPTHNPVTSRVGHKRKQIWRTFKYDSTISHDKNLERAEQLLPFLKAEAEVKYCPPTKSTQYSGPCAHCGVFRVRLQRDRIVPGFRGGEYIDGNIQLLCANCHETKSRAEQKEWVKEKRERRQQRDNERRLQREREIDAFLALSEQGS